MADVRAYGMHCGVGHTCHIPSIENEIVACYACEGWYGSCIYTAMANGSDSGDVVYHCVLATETFAEKAFQSVVAILVVIIV